MHCIAGVFLCRRDWYFLISFVFKKNPFVVSLSNNERGFRTSGRPVMPDADPASSKAVTPAPTKNDAGINSGRSPEINKQFLYPFFGGKEATVLIVNTL